MSANTSASPTSLLSSPLHRRLRTPSSRPTTKSPAPTPPTPPETLPDPLPQPLFSSIDQLDIDDPTIAPHLRRNRARRQRLAHERLSIEQLLDRARFLPPDDRNLLVAHFHHGLPLSQIALLRNRSEKTLAKRIHSLREALSDSIFLLAVHYVPLLPQPHRLIAHDYFLAGCPLRHIARTYSTSLHRIRQSLLIARSLMLIALAEKQKLPSHLPRKALGLHPQTS